MARRSARIGNCTRVWIRADIWVLFGRRNAGMTAGMAIRRIALRDPPNCLLEAFFEAFELLFQGGGEAVAEAGEVLADGRDLVEPGIHVYVEELSEVVGVEVEAGEVEVAGVRDASEGRFAGAAAAVAAFEDPL